MVDRSELSLGQHVVVRLFGGETVGAVIDGLCNDWVGVRLDRGGYVIADWEDIEVGEVEAEEGNVVNYGCITFPLSAEINRMGLVKGDKVKLIIVKDVH